MEIRANKLVVWKLGRKDVEELHQPRGDVLWLTEVRPERHQALQALHQTRALQRVRV